MVTRPGHTLHVFFGNGDTVDRPLWMSQWHLRQTTMVFRRRLAIQTTHCGGLFLPSFHRVFM
jgi:hypothetical protein